MEFRIYEDNSQMFRWRLVAPNGRIIADSSEAYVSKSNVRRAIEGVKDGLKNATIQEATDETSGQ